MAADQDVSNALNGVQQDGSSRPWAFVKVRARTVLGNLKAIPFWRQLGSNRVAVTPSAFDHLIGTAEQIAWRYVASDGNVWDLHDFLITLIEKTIAETDAAKLTDARNKAAVLRPWPPGYAGAPDFER